MEDMEWSLGVDLLFSSPEPKARTCAYTRCITISDSICAVRTLSVFSGLYLCWHRTLSVNKQGPVS